MVASFVLFIYTVLMSIEIEVFLDILLALQFGEEGIELLREELADFSPQSPEIVCTIYPPKRKEMTATYPTECDVCLIRGQCTAFDKQVLTTKGRCKYHQGADCEKIFASVW